MMPRGRSYRVCGFFVAGALLALSFGGCMISQVNFLKTAPFAEGRKKQVEWYLDRLPSRAYRSVGIIEVIHSADAGMLTVLRSAHKLAQEVGCDLIVDRSLHRFSFDTARPLPRHRGAVTGRCQFARPGVSPHYQPAFPPPAAASAPPGTTAFICGVYEPAQDPPSGPAHPVPAQ